MRVKDNSMKSNELRIGNYYDNNGRIMTITPSVIQDVFESERVWCKQIPLTEEWLLKFGFNGWDLYKYTLIRTNGNFFVEGCNEPIAKNIYFVHQLQNLYFALTNEELKINL